MRRKPKPKQRRNISPYDVHHMMPLSKGGEDHETNKMRYLREIHTGVIHDILTMKKGKYSKLNRKRNIAQNGKMLKTQETLKIEHEMQKDYFRNLYKLPQDIITDHEEVAEKRVKRQSLKLENITGQGMYEKMDDFESYHDRYYTILQEIQRALKKALLYFFKKNDTAGPKHNNSKKHKIHNNKTQVTR